MKGPGEVARVMFVLTEPDPTDRILYQYFGYYQFPKFLPDHFSDHGLTDEDVCLYARLAFVFAEDDLNGINLPRRAGEK